MAKSNFTPAWVYGIWAGAMTLAMLALGIHYHPGPSAYIFGGGVWAGGIGIMIVQIVKGGDTNFFPYLVQTAGAIIFAAIATSAPVV